MARFTLDRDIRFFEGISRELVDAVITTAVVLYKLVIEDSKTNLVTIQITWSGIWRYNAFNIICTVGNIKRFWKSNGWEAVK